LNGSGVRDDGTSGGLTYRWDLDGDGSFETSGQNPTFSAATLDGSSVVNIALQVCDGPDLCAVKPTTVTVTNVPPHITGISNSGPVPVGSPATITVKATDPAGPRDPLGYEFDCDNNGSYEVGPQASNTAPCTFSTPGIHTVRVRVND